MLFAGRYSIGTRFGVLPGSNLEELPPAPRGVLSMACTAFLGTHGHPSASMDAKAICTVQQAENGIKITKIRWQVTGAVPGLTPEQFAATRTEPKRRAPSSMRSTSTSRSTSRQPSRRKSWQRIERANELFARFAGDFTSASRSDAPHTCAR